MDAESPELYSSTMFLYRCQWRYEAKRGIKKAPDVGFIVRGVGDAELAAESVRSYLPGWNSNSVTWVTSGRLFLLTFNLACGVDEITPISFRKLSTGSSSPWNMDVL